jgi:CrcB protein
MNWIWVGLGGMIGSMARYAISTFVAQLFEKALLPYGLITVNILGCLLIGFLSGFMQMKQGMRPELVLFLMVGLLGGFTTFSSFGLETFVLLRQNAVMTALIDVLLQVGFGTLSVAIGFYAALKLIGPVA